MGFLTHIFNMETGKLYIIGSPIGNLADMTYRAVKILQDEVDFVLCEDTRQTRKLLNHYNIDKPTGSFHSHSSDEKISTILKNIKDGKTLSYLSDAGTPGISDPGSKLISYAIKENIEVIPIPGVSALTSIASITGFPVKEIMFAGFISKKPGKRINELSKFKGFNGVIVIYESPYRILKLLNAIAEVFPDTDIVIGREMTKMFEEYIRLNTNEISEKADKIKEKGEFSVAILNKL